MLFDAAQKSIMPYGQDLRLKLARQKDSSQFQPGVNTELAADTVVIVSVTLDYSEIETSEFCGLAFFSRCVTRLSSRSRLWSTLSGSCHLPRE